MGFCLIFLQKFVFTSLSQCRRQPLIANRSHWCHNDGRHCSILRLNGESKSFKGLWNNLKCKNKFTKGSRLTRDERLRGLIRVQRGRRTHAGGLQGRFTLTRLPPGEATSYQIPVESAASDCGLAPVQPVVSFPAVQWLRHALVSRGENKTKQKRGGRSQGLGVSGRGANTKHAECVGVAGSAHVG